MVDGYIDDERSGGVWVAEGRRKRHQNCQIECYGYHHYENNVDYWYEYG
jgi:hypothetical protein